METELHLSSKLNSLLRVFTKDCFFVLLADLETGRAETIHVSEPVLPLLEKRISDTHSFEEFLAYIEDNFIDADRQDAFSAGMNPNALSALLCEKGAFNISIHISNDGKNSPAEIIIADISETEDGSQCAIIARFSEDIVREQFALKKQDDMVKTLVRDYTAIYYIDLEENSFTILHANNIVNEDLYDYSYRNLPFETAMNSFIEKDVRAQDRETMTRLSRCSYIKKRLMTENGYSCRYQVTPTKGMEYFEMRILRVQDDDHARFAIMAVRNVDDAVREELKAQQDAEAVNRELDAKTARLAEASEIIAGAGLGIWHIVHDTGKHPRMVGNPKTLEILGADGQHMTEEELYYYWHSHIVDKDTVTIHESAMAMIEGKFSEEVYRWRHPDKDIIYIRGGGYAREQESGHQVTSGYLSDATEIVEEDQRRKEALSSALAAAEQANRAKTVFLSNMSHDIRTPMNAIVGFAGIAAAHPDDAERVKDSLNKILLSSNHLHRLINDILDMSYIESGKTALNEKKCGLSEIVHNILPVVQPQIAAKRQEFYVDTIGVHDEYVYADALKLNQALINLIGNAVKFTPTAGTIGVKIEQHAGTRQGYASYRFIVKDNGIGMSEEFLSHLFSPFERESNATVSGIEGTGLGLAITKNIIEMMGGTIAVESELGKGSAFTADIELKLQDDIRPDWHIEQLDGFRALVVDDDYDSCHGIANMLLEIGLRPDWTSSAKEALFRAQDAYDKGDPYGVYIIDWIMPEMNGIELVRRLRKNIDPDIPIVIVTAYDWSNVADEARDAGVTAFCTKPVFMSDLEHSLLESLGMHEEQKPPDDDLDVRFPNTRLLVVEDNELNREIALTVLKEAGFEVDSAGDGSEAIELLESSKPGFYDVVIMDVQMPVMNGYEATQEIRRSSRADIAELPVIAMTANAFEEDRKRAASSGMNAHIAKPLDAKLLIDTIRSFLK